MVKGEVVREKSRDKAEEEGRGLDWVRARKNFELYPKSSGNDFEQGSAILLRFVKVHSGCG